MKIVLSICCLFMMISLEAQSEIVGKTYTAHIGSSCEEVIGDDSCAGLEIYMELYFEENNVDVIEVSVNSCDERISEMIDGFPWHWAKNKHWTIVLGDLERIKYTIMENIRLTMRNGKLIGEKINDKGNIVQEYRFHENTK